MVGLGLKIGNLEKPLMKRRFAGLHKEDIGSNRKHFGRISASIQFDSIPLRIKA